MIVPAGNGPEISFIMPCYNEQDVIPYTIPQFVQAFQKAGHRLELVACDNGSTDRTSEILKGFVDQGLPIIYHRVEPNEGYGNGVLKSIPVCTAPWIGMIPADGQVDADDTARLFEVIKHTDGRVLAKVRRRFRMDGLVRKVISIVYNGLVFVLWPRLGSIDINGTPKILHRDVIAAMNLEERQWFLDPEIMVKAHYLGVRVIEVNVFARMRSNGMSNIRASSVVEFFLGLLRYKFGGALSKWKKTHPKVVIRAGHQNAAV